MSFQYIIVILIIAAAAGYAGYCAVAKKREFDPKSCKTGCGCNGSDKNLIS